MILVILAITIALIIGGILIEQLLDDVGAPIFCIGCVAFFNAIVATIWLGVNVSYLNTIDERIAMYQEENTKIEEQIATVVEQYQEYETKIFTEVSPESAITLVALYPDLKADELVKSQIDIYVENNKQIKTLQEEKITASVKRWWLYFGS